MSMLDELRAVVDSLTPGQRATLAELLAADAPRAAPAPAPAPAPDEPIAILGMAGRFPGAPDLDAFWDLLSAGRDAIVEVPAARWPAARFYHPDRTVPGKMATRWGGFLDDIDQFDAEFFGITPREAQAMDPQQRVFLETAWQALDDAGLPPGSLRRSPTGVFVGVSNFDYMWHQFGRLDRIDAYASSGSAHCIVANRLSYLLDLAGPSVAVDAACASSLVAVHLACQSLRARDCDAAIAGAVNLVLAPQLCISLSAWGMMAADGRCKTFDARADGFVRGEGSGAIVVKRLADAERDGDHVRAVIRGSAVNQDGRTNGLTAPSGAAQQAVIRQALARAGVAPSQVSFLETHGTGTSLGDPIEVEAINEIFGGHTARCVLGAVKTNLGHLEPAAGIASLIKAVLALEHGVIPRNLHCRTLNPLLSLAPGIELAGDAVAWPRGPAQRFAGVSGFSFGGTNAHVVIAEAPAAPRPAAPPAGATVVVLSAHSEPALREMARRHAALLGRGDPAITLDAVAGLRARHRDHLAVRVAAVGDERAAVAGALRSFADGVPHAGIVHGQRRTPLRLVFLYTGQGSAWAGMGSALYRTEPAFRAAIDEVDAVFQRAVGTSHRRVIAGELDDTALAAALDRTDVAQPAIFLVQVALTRTLACWGLEPGAVAGHSVGEIAAAWAAGAIDLDDAVRVVHHRSQLMQRTAGQGAMASVALAPAEARRWLETRPELVIAAHNGPRSVVVAGEPDALDELVGALTSGGVRARRLAVDHAFHSPQMDPLRDELARRLAGVVPRPPRLAFYSTVTGQREHQATAGAAHWVRNLRDPVAFADVVERLGAEPSLFLELGPHPALTPHVADALDRPGQPALTAACMRRDRGDRRALLTAVAALYVHGIAPDWSRLIAPPDRSIALPAYPWQRRRHWIDAPEPGEPAGARDAAADTSLCYRTTWRVDAAAPAAALGRSYLVVAGDGALGRALRDAIRAAGGQCWWYRTTAPGGSAGAVFDADGGTLDATSDDQLRQLFGHLADSLIAIDHIVVIAPPAAGELDPAGPCQLVRGLAQRRLASACRAELAVITRAAVNAGDDREAAPAHAALWGLGRALALEHPELGVQLIDLPAAPADPAAEAAAVVARLAGAEPERQSAWRAGSWWVPRLTAYAPAPSAAPALSPDGTYLITGGLGSLGLATAARLVQRGVRTLALLARRPATAAHAAAIAALEAQGARVIALTGDIADLRDARRVFDQLARSTPPVTGVIHAAGVVDDGLFVRATRDSFDRVLAPKLAGSWNLHRLTQDLALERFVLFSSATAVLGAAGQTSYAAANAFLEGLAEHRRGLGLPALCVHWGAWRDSAMVTEPVAARLARLGFATMASDAALDALEQVLDGQAAAPVVIAADWSQVAAGLASPGLARVLAALVRSDAAPSSSHGTPGGQLRAELAGAPASQRTKRLYGRVRAAVLAIIGLDPAAEVSPDQGLVQLGIDSLLAVQIASRLSRDLACELSRTVIYEHPTLERLTEHLLAVAFPTAPEAVAGGLGELAAERDAIASANAQTLQHLLDEELASLLLPGSAG